MKSYKTILSIYVLLILFPSCTSTRSIVNHCKSTPQKLNMHHINGTYEGIALWQKFRSIQTTKIDTTQYSPQAFTTIQFDGKGHITASVYENETKLKEITLKAKVYKDYISVEKRHTLHPFIPIYYYSEMDKFILFNNSENLLSLCGYSNKTLIILIMSGGNGGYYSSTFNKIK